MDNRRRTMKYDLPSPSPLPRGLCRNFVHGSRTSSRTEYGLLKINKLAVRPELVEGQMANYDTVSWGERVGVRGFSLIETIIVMVIIGILAAVVIPRIGFDTTPRASVEGAAHMVASDIRYVQECAMANRVSKSIAFVSGQSLYTFPATTPSTNNFDPSGRLPSGVTVGTTITITFNSLGEPTTGAASVTVSGSAGSKTISISNYTGKVSVN